jgi:integrating conjugative element membrane protein (TIGR03745 family)
MTMQNRILNSRLAQRAAVALGAAALPVLSFAQGLPQLENPTRGTGNGIMETIRNYGYDIIMLVALLVVASMFIGVCYHAYGTYAEIHTGRKTWRRPARDRHLAAHRSHRHPVRRGRYV